jgi:hypothetical protein
MNHLGRYNVLMLAELRPEDLQPLNAGAHAEDYSGFEPHEFDKLLR